MQANSNLFYNLNFCKASMLCRDVRLADAELRSACVTVIDALGVSFQRNYRSGGQWLQWADLPLSLMSDGECVVHVSASRRFAQQRRVLKVGSKKREGVTWVVQLGNDQADGAFDELGGEEEEEEEGEEHCP